MQKNLSEPLAFILNLSLSSSIFPDKLKVARVVPIFKKGEKCNPGNYRPISILPVISKLFEKLVNTRVIIFWKRMVYCMSINMDSGKVSIPDYLL